MCHEGVRLRSIFFQKPPGTTEFIPAFSAKRTHGSTNFPRRRHVLRDIMYGQAGHNRWSRAQSQHMLTGLLYTCPVGYSLSTVLRSSMGVVLTFVGAFVPMLIWRIGSGSGLLISATAMLSVFAVLFYVRRRYSLVVFAGLLSSGAATLVWLSIAASNATIEPGTSLREIDLAAKWVFFANACIYAAALLVPIWLRRVPSPNPPSHRVSRGNSPRS
jgi:hypothetical protein